MTEPKKCTDECLKAKEDESMDRCNCTCHTPVSEPKRCCDRCALYHVSLDRPPELVACAKKFCECHTTTQPTVRISEQKSLHSTEEAQATTVPVYHIPTPPDTRPAYLWDKEAKDVARTVGNMIRENEGTTPTPPPTGNYFQYRADPNEKKLEFDAPPTEGWEERFQEVAKKLNLREETVSGVDEYGMVRNLITQALAEQKARMVEVVEGFKGEDLLIDEVVDDIIKAFKKRK